METAVLTALARAASRILPTRWGTQLNGNTLEGFRFEKLDLLVGSPLAGEPN